MNRTIYIVMLILPLSAGLPFAQSMAQDQRPLVAFIQNLDQAKDILKPENKLLMITHDPFTPIIVKDPDLSALPTALNQTGPEAQTDVNTDEDLKDVEVMGIVRLDQEYRAYIMVGKETHVVKLQDKIRNYTITSINMSQIVFKSGTHVIVKKRGKP